VPISKESREQLGRALTEAREEAGLTVVQLAQIASPGRVGGLSRYYDAEAGRRMATSETVSHYATALGRADLHDLRNKILSKRPVPISPANNGAEERPQTVGPHVLLASDDDQTAPPASTRATDTIAGRDTLEVELDQPDEALPIPELLPRSLDGPIADLVGAQGPLPNGSVVRGRDAILSAACSLLEEAITICTDETRSVSVQVIQMNPERSFTRNLGMSTDQASRFFPYQIQRLVAAGGSVRHLLASEIMHTLDMWSAIQRFIGLMELAGDYSVYWPSRHTSGARMSDYLVIDNVAALEIFPTGPLTWAGDAAIVHRSPSPAVSVIKDFGENLIAEAEEAFQVTDPSSTYAVEQARVWVEQAILETEQTPAPRFLFKYGLSTLTEPLKSYETRLRDLYNLESEDRASWPIWVKQDLEVRRRRLANFLKQINKHRSIDIVPLSALRFYVDHGRYSEICSEFGDYTVPVASRIKHLQDVITMISTNQLYDLVVLEDDPPLTSLVGVGMVMMGRPEEIDEQWMIFYQSEKPNPSGEPISVAFETRLDLFRHRVGGRIASIEKMADSGATQNTLRLLHRLIDELRAKSTD
jgi:hypothetical protein